MKNPNNVLLTCTIPFMLTIYSNLAFSHTCTATEPLVVDMAADGIELSKKGVGVIFDITGTGNPVKIQWLRENGDEAFLFKDSNLNGIVDNGSELFGDSMPLLDGSGLKARHGFQALAQYDKETLGGNNDGLITSEDLVWSDLKLWNDSNADGISTEDEILSISESLILSLPTIPKVKQNSVDEAGNVMPYEGKATGYTQKNENDLRKEKFDVVDVYFHLILD